MKFTNTDCVGKVVSCELDSQVEGKMDYWEWWRVLDYFFSFTVYEQVEKQVRVQVLNQVFDRFIQIPCKIHQEKNK